MTADSDPRRSPLLPVLAGSRAVLVGRDTPEPDADHGFGDGYESAVAATGALARTLASRDIAVRRSSGRTSNSSCAGSPPTR
ncbi:hypothetical protein [Micromonospora sagamiensis]|uniref:hypothetical protein n=1 Tax=Micromonospora sagamiensis TaxID=47875 RepID=UPI0011A4153B|nr:hypothetical protein [Micromonospora sagamiensis]BCL12432.1 hypothetical protein GCM10017556_01710 [Micromonospora sagamiensis]